MEFQELFYTKYFVCLLRVVLFFLPFVFKVIQNLYFKSNLDEINNFHFIVGNLMGFILMRRETISKSKFISFTEKTLRLLFYIKERVNFNFQRERENISYLIFHKRKHI